MVIAAAVFAPRGLPLAKVDDIGVFEHVADAHVDTFAVGGLAQLLPPPGSCRFFLRKTVGRRLLPVLSEVQF
jgi:hypothetical protein